MSTLSPLATVVAAPAHIAVSGQLDALLLTMEGGTVIELPATRLRASCKCAHCLRARIDGVFPDRFTGIAITDVAPIGGYAVNIARAKRNCRFALHNPAKAAQLFRHPPLRASRVIVDIQRQWPLSALRPQREGARIHFEARGPGSSKCFQPVKAIGRHAGRRQV